ncbi:MAG: polysaccharide biosynthesis protein, partial [Cyanobacteria bacterium]|nr:polysaccharide biosynthesis protein [Cyanobacteriota bacterium]
MEELSGLGLVVLTIPSLTRIASGDQAVSDLRPVSVEDLLGREPSQPDPELTAASVAGKVVMVTGAGGSIGSELCRQILRFRAAGLVLLERNEFALYVLEHELEAACSKTGHPPTLLRAVLGDANDLGRLEA